MIDEKIRNVFSSVFELDPTMITNSTSTSNLPNWDSLGHLRLILELEAVYSIQFETAEIPNMTSVEIIDNTIKKYL